MVHLVRGRQVIAQINAHSLASLEAGSHTMFPIFIVDAVFVVSLCWSVSWPCVLFKISSLHYFDSKEDAATTGPNQGSLAVPDPKGKFAVSKCHWHVNESKKGQMLLGPILEWVRNAFEAADSAQSRPCNWYDGSIHVIEPPSSQRCVVRLTTTRVLLPPVGRKCCTTAAALRLTDSEYLV